MKLWLARHGPPLVEQGVCYGATDVEAEPHATQRLARDLAAALPAGLSTSSSPLRRCTQLAEALRALRPDLAWRGDARIAEMDFGGWEGRSWDAIGRAEFEQWTANFADHRCGGGGESVSQLMGRVALALQAARNAGGDALWLTHAGVIRAARLLQAGVAMPALAADWPRAEIAFGQLVCLDMTPP